MREVVRKLRAFRDARDWSQFHAPKDLAAALAIEAGELQQLFLWKRPDEIEAIVTSEEGRGHIAAEIADVLTFALYLADRLEIDVAGAIAAKIARNESRYPADEHRGVADRARRRGR
ncbi:MAG: nucleotide pyrophosphohydrolase [Planctomycetes bacterium]|nr:nucleotide pyrophosphohydrolase [Planctomycetota bacterium]